MTNEIALLQPGPTDVSGASDDDQFVDLFVSRYNSEATRRTYRIAINKFRSWFRGGLLKQATVAEAVHFADWMNRSKPATKRITLAALSALWEFGVRTRYLIANIWKLAGIKVEVERPKKWLDEDEALAVIRNAPKGYEVLFAVLYYCGLRIGEALSLTWEGVTEREGLADLAVIGKGRKRRTVTLPRKQSLRLLADRGGDDEPVFGMSDSAVRAALKEACRRAGITKKVSPHWLRAMHATHALLNGADLATTRDNLGHASISTTNVYLHSKPGASTSRFIKQDD